MKKIIVIALSVLGLVLSSCTKLEFGASVNDIIGTQWSKSLVDDENKIKVTESLSFYGGGMVTSLVDNKYGIQTVNGHYEYFPETKTFSFNGIIWYVHGQPIEYTGAYIIDDDTLEVVILTSDKIRKTYYLYRTH